jgi:hypothetical protein
MQTESDPAPFTAPPFTTTTIISKGQVGIGFKCQGRVIGASVDAKIKEVDIQRLVANWLQMNLIGYWVATVVEGTRRIGALVNGPTVELTPATADQIRGIVQARTTATAEPKKGKDVDTRELKPGYLSPNWLASREERVAWGEFAAGLERDKMVHIITDGGGLGVNGMHDTEDGADDEVYGGTGGMGI